MRFLDLVVAGIAVGIGFSLPIAVLVWFVSVLP